MPVVTSTFASKTPSELQAISTNLVAAEPTLDSVTAALAAAVARLADRQARSTGSRVAWEPSGDDAEAPRAALEALLADAS
jgi:hypothetical protein